MVLKSAGFIGVIILFAANISVRTSAMQKMKPEELVDKHLASIGSPEARAAAHNRVVKGSADVVFNPGPRNATSGNAAFISDGKSVRLGWIFAALNYPGEDFAFDGENVGVGFVRPGVRSLLSQFMLSNDFLIKEGFLGGALTTAWALLDVPGRKAKIEYNGLKKKAGKEYHEIRYLARKGGGDVRVFMYFDPQTFHHMQTQYTLIQMGQKEKRYYITEEFDKFVVADGLTLPTSYKMNFTIEEDSSTMLDWTVKVDQILHNQQIDPKTFILQ
jgi:hypothetical protein